MKKFTITVENDLHFTAAIADNLRQIKKKFMKMGKEIENEVGEEDSVKEERRRGIEKWKSYGREMERWERRSIPEKIKDWFHRTPKPSIVCTDKIFRPYPYVNIPEEWQDKEEELLNFESDYHISLPRETLEFPFELEESLRKIENIFGAEDISEAFKERDEVISDAGERFIGYVKTKIPYVRLCFRGDTSQWAEEKAIALCGFELSVVVGKSRFDSAYH